MYALNYSTITDENSPEYNLIQNGNAYPAVIQSTTDFGILGDNAMTCAAWIRYDDLNDSTNGVHCILQMGDAGSGAQGRVNWNFRAANNDIQIAVGGGNVASVYDPTVTLIEDGNWHHVAFTYDKGDLLSEIIFYIDGVAVVNSGGNDGVALNLVADKLSIGATAVFQQKWFDGGGIDDLRIYDYAVTAAEIASIYGGGYLSTTDVAFGDNELKAYPTAVDDFLKIQTTSNGSLQISVFDITGKNIIRTSGNNVDMSGLKTGMYIVKVREDNKVANLKILKK